MIEFLFQYGLFLAKVLTLVLSLIFVVLAILMIASRFRTQGQEGTFIIDSINERLDDIADVLNSKILSKTEYKAKLKAEKEARSKLSADRPRLFVLQFEGDIRASQVSSLREVITAIINTATPQDEVLLILESGGGFVPHYGLAASQLARFRERKIPLTVAIDKVAASGGYMMACVANKIICAPFAIVGSIGVMAIIPNFNRLLEKHDVDIEQHTAGQYKRTLTFFGRNTDEAREKFKEDLSETHAHFKEFILQYRPQVNMEQTATGEHWSGEKAKTLNLVDELQTSDDYILSKYPDYKIFKISFMLKTSLKEKLSSGFASAASMFLEKLWLPFLK
jgi:serine protease SohB